MTIHKEGYKILTGLLFALTAINFGLYHFLPENIVLHKTVLIISILLYLLILQFFRSPNRPIEKNSKHLIAPADGKVVVIEEVVETEYFKDKRRQISIFMSPFNVHINRSPVAGMVEYFKYHPGKFLVAWHPKSSTENERTTLVIKSNEGPTILLRQIAGALAKRIVWYCKPGVALEQGEEFGFIKFGSRVDIFLPLDAKINVEMGQVTKGGKTIIAEFV